MNRKLFRRDQRQRPPFTSADLVVVLVLSALTVLVLNALAATLSQGWRT